MAKDSQTIRCTPQGGNMADSTDREAIVRECAKIVMIMAANYEDMSRDEDDMAGRIAKVLRLAARRIRRLAHP